MLARGHTEAAFHPLQRRVRIRLGVVVLDIEDVGALVPGIGCGVSDLPCQRLQGRQVSPAFNVEHVSLLAGPDVVIGTVVAERGDDVGPGCQLVRVPAEQQRQVAVECLAQDDLGVRDENDLGVVALCNIAQKHIGLPLAKNLQVRVRFVNQQDAARVRVQVGEDEKHLLKASTRKGDVQRSTYFGLMVEEVDRSTPRLGGVLQPNVKQTLHQLLYSRPGRTVIPEDHKAQVAQHLGRLPLTQQDIHPAGLNDRLLGLDARHRVQQSHIEARRRLDEFGHVQSRLVGRTVDEFVAVAAEPHGYRLDPVVVKYAEGDLERDVLAAGSDDHVVPVVACAPHRNRNDSQPVEAGGGALRGRRLAFAIEPRLHRLRPESDRLQRRRLAAVVGADQDRRMVELNARPVTKPLEVADFEVVEVPHLPPPRAPRISRFLSANSTSSSSSSSS